MTKLKHRVGSRQRSATIGSRSKSPAKLAAAAVSGERARAVRLANDFQRQGEAFIIANGLLDVHTGQVVPS